MFKHSYFYLYDQRKFLSEINSDEHKTMQCNIYVACFAFVMLLLQYPNAISVLKSTVLEYLCPSMLIISSNPMITSFDKCAFI